MRTGLDTGFFIALYQGKEEAVNLWERLQEKDLVVCILSGYEFFKVLMRKGEPMRELEEFWRSIEEACEILPVDGEAIREAAKLERTYQLGGLDSLILTVLLGGGCREILTTDSRWEKAFKKRKNIKIKVFLKRKK